MLISQQLECLKTVVGLSPTSDPCFDSGKPAGANDSLSGEYISTLLRLTWLQGAQDSEIGDIWDMLESARNRGIKKVVLDYIKMLSSRKKERYLPFEGYVGDSTFNLSLNPMGDFQAIEIEPYESKGAFLVVEGIELALDNLAPPVAVDVFIYRSTDTTTPIAQTTVTLTADNTFAAASFADPVKLDFDRLQTGEKYWFVYEVPAGAKVKNNQLESGCGCGSKRSRIDKNRFLQFGNWLSVEADSIAALSAPTGRTGYAQGLRLKASASCDYFSWLCDISKNINEISTSINSGNLIKLGMTLADLIQYASALFAAEDIVNSTNINRITTLKKEHIWGKMKKWQKEYNNGLMWFVDEIPSFVNDCFVCKKDMNLSVNSILV